MVIVTTAGENLNLLDESFFNCYHNQRHDQEDIWEIKCKFIDTGHRAIFFGPPGTEIWFTSVVDFGTHLSSPIF